MRNTNFVVKIKRKKLHWRSRHIEKNSKMDWSNRVCVRTWNGFNWLKILCSREKWRRCGCTNDAVVWPRLLSWDERTTTDTSGCLTTASIFEPRTLGKRNSSSRHSMRSRHPSVQDPGNKPRTVGIAASANTSRSDAMVQ
jgi:hypothetical protein